jgi:hypothetical protein
MDVEAGSLEEQVSRAVYERLDTGTSEIVAVTYRYAGTTGDMDGLVIGELEGMPNARAGAILGIWRSTL